MSRLVLPLLGAASLLIVATLIGAVFSGVPWLTALAVCALTVMVLAAVVVREEGPL